MSIVLRFGMEMLYKILVQNVFFMSKSFSMPRIKQLAYYIWLQPNSNIQLQ